MEECRAELKRCAVELGFPGVVIASELQGQALDAEALRPFWRCCAELDLYVYIHPLPRVIAWPQMYVDDLGRMLGWEFSLMVAAVRLINSGLFDELPTLRVHLSHFGGGIGRYLPRIRGLQDRGRNGTTLLPNHCYVEAVRAGGVKALAMLNGANARVLIRDLDERRRLAAPGVYRGAGRSMTGKGSA